MAGKKKNKFYVVWEGHRTGIFTSWKDCQAVTAGYANARYKGFPTLDEANAALKAGWQAFYGNKPSKAEKKQKTAAYLHEKYGVEIEINSIAVDAACSGNPGKMEYRGVQTVTAEEIFRSPVFPVGTNNIGEFLAIVHALALFSEKQPDLTIYTDSRIAMGWVKRKQVRTKLPHNQKTDKLYELIARGEKWLKTHKWKNPIVKWETKEWGEIPADFGRK